MKALRPDGHDHLSFACLFELVDYSVGEKTREKLRDQVDQSKYLVIRNEEKARKVVRTLAYNQGALKDMKVTVELEGLVD